MKKTDYLSTLFVGIDIGSRTNVVSAIDFNQDFYDKKFAETTTHQHKRALALTSRKFLRMLFGLLDKSQLYSLERSR